VGYINQRRSNYHFGEVLGEKRDFGICDFEINSRRRIAEPQSQLLGFIARITLYMESIYDMGLTGGEIECLKQQSLAYPPTKWEILRDQRIAEIQGNHNPFIER
jgi:deoxyribonuclease-1